jgi:outer membrane protein TolC
MMGSSAKRLSTRVRPAGVLFLSFLLAAAAAAGQEPDFQKLGPLPPVPEMPVGPIEKAEADGTALHLSMRAMARLALEHNLDIAISNLNEELSRLAILQTHGVYDPVFSAAIGAFSQKNANTNLATASALGNYNKFDIAQWNFQFQQNTATGGTVTASYNSNRLNTNQTFSLFSPQYSAALTFNATQPLLRNLRIDQNRGNIELAKLDLRMTDSQSQQRLVNAIAEILAQYWDLIGAIRDYEIKRESVRLAQVTLRDNQRKLEVGSAARITVSEARATVAQREVELLAAEEKIYILENTLRALLSDDRRSEIWNKVIIPTEKPDYRDYKIDLGTAIETAVRNRPELEQLDLGMQKLEVNERLSTNLRKWQLDLTATFGTTGVAGPQSYVTDPFTGVTRIVIEPRLVGSVGRAYKVLFTEGFTNWSVGFDLKIPLRNRAAESQLAQVKVGQRQQFMRRRNTEQSVRAEVANAYQALDTSRKQVQTAEVAVKLAGEQLWGEEKRFQGGTSATFRVLQRQSEYSTAQGNEVQALITHKKAIIALQKAMNSLLQSDEYEIVKGRAGYELREK